MLLKKVVLAAALVLSAVGQAYSASVEPVTAEISAQRTPSSGLFFNGEFNFELTDELMDVLLRGITLSFVLEVEVEKKRWYWFDRDIAGASEHIRLSFNPLTRKYKLSIGGMTQSFESPAAALAMMKNVSNLYLGSCRELNPEGYSAKARFYLDTSKLPKPFQVTLRREDGWNVDSGWFPVKITRSEG